jgi:hypothetical protein
MALRRRRNPSKSTGTRANSSTSAHRKPAGWNKRTRSLARRLGVNPLTLQAAAILVLALGTAVLWNAFDTVDPRVRLFLREICRYEATYCNEVLRPSHRTQKTTRDLPSGQRLVEVPRHLLLWDLDALRNDFVQNELFGARIFGIKPLDADAFLSAYLAVLQHNKTGLSPILQSYLEILPSYHDFASFHPILLENNVSSLVGKESYSYQLVRHVRQKVNLEYEALTNASEAFARLCSWSDFVTARLTVLTRSFGTGRLHENERDSEHFNSLEEELGLFRDKAGVDISSGSFALVPILDLYNHHAQPTVGYSYDPVKRAFVIRSLGLTAGHELWDSYGKHSDAHLYAKFGFINGDGSESVQACVSVWHGLYDLSNETKADELLRYLSFDDGYDDCIQPDETTPAWELKRLKYQHLWEIAHNTKFWTVVVPPRQRDARPAASSVLSSEWPPRGIIRTLDVSRGSPDVQGVLAACRLLVVTHEDFDGTATQLLRDHLPEAGSYMLPPSSPHDALEYRTLQCVERLSSQSISRFGTTVNAAKKRVTQAEASLDEDSRTEWTAAHLRLGELQTLDLLRGMAVATIRQEWPTEQDRPGRAYRMRRTPCPVHLLQPLLAERGSMLLD